MVQFVLLILTIGFIIWFQVRSKVNSRGYRRDFEEFMEKERQANMSRRKDIPEEFFIKPNTEQLPVKNHNQNPALAAKQTQVLKAAQNPMLKFPQPKSNLEIKTEFGIANLEDVIKYEENHQAYLRKLLEWAELLKREGNSQDAQKVLSEAIDFGADNFRTFQLFDETCTDLEDTDRLRQICKRITEGELLKDNEFLKTKVLDCFDKTIGGKK